MSQPHIVIQPCLSCLFSAIYQGILPTYIIRTFNLIPSHPLVLIIPNLGESRNKCYQLLQPIPISTGTTL